mgnify:CR=1 FL=1|tara:strand:+ start:114 stop:1787 length:1674 start_codon:yes stop_codon:yes gene_type:complete
MSHAPEILPVFEVNEPISLAYGAFSWEYTDDSLAHPSYPTPRVTWTTEKQRNNAGSFQSEETNVNIVGVVSRHSLFEHSNGQSKTTFEVLMEEATHLRDEIIANDNGFLIFHFDGVPMVSGNAVIQSLEFSPNENYWTTTIDYSLSLRISNPDATGYLPAGQTGKTYHITDSSNAVSIERDDRTYVADEDGSVHYLYRLTRNASATAKAYGDTERGALSFAKAWVTGIVSDLRTFVAPHFRLYNKTSTVDFSETNGQYSVQETYILKSGNPWIYTEQADISTNRDNDIRTITIAGEVEGLEPALGTFYAESGIAHNSGLLDISGVAPQLAYTKGDTYQFLPLAEGQEESEEEAEDTTEIYTKYDNAVSGYMLLVDNFFESAMHYDDEAKSLNGSISARPLHAIPVSTEEGFSPQQGKITYSRSYDSRPTGLLEDSVFEVFTYTDSKPKSLISTVPVIGRRLGPLYYNPQGYSNIRNATFASGVGTRTITYEAFFSKPTGLGQYKFPQEIIDKIDNYLYRYEPGGKYTGYVKSDTQELNLTDNKIVKSITWDYIECNP